MRRLVTVCALWLAADAEGARRYHRLPLAQVGVSQRTHIETCGLVTYRRLMADGDWHLTLDDTHGGRLVVEIIPLIPLEPPRKGVWVTVGGIRRYDEGHNWPEIHPVEYLRPAKVGCAAERPPS